MPILGPIRVQEYSNISLEKYMAISKLNSTLP